MAAAGFELRRAYNTELRRMETARVLPMTARQTTNANFADRQRVLRGDPGASVAVPCAGCSACCWAKYIEVEPELERPEDLAVLNTATSWPRPVCAGALICTKALYSVHFFRIIFGYQYLNDPCTAWPSHPPLVHRMPLKADAFRLTNPETKP